MDALEDTYNYARSTSGISKKYKKHKPRVTLKAIFELVGGGVLIINSIIDLGYVVGLVLESETQGYDCFWIIFLGIIILYLFQEAAVIISCQTMMDLADLIKTGIPQWMRYLMWILIELTLVFNDSKNILGSSYSLAYILGLDHWIALFVIFTLAIILIFFYDFFPKILEIFLGMMVIITCGFFTYTMYSTSNNFKKASLGLIPRFEFEEIRSISVLLGGMIMSNNIYLHSSLIAEKSRKHQNRFSKSGMMALFRAELIITLVIVLWMMLGLFFTFSPLFHTDTLSGLLEVGEKLFYEFGIIGGNLYHCGIILIGLGSTFTSALTGRFMMIGFLDLNLNYLVRNIVSRLITILPCVLILWLIEMKSASMIINLFMSCQLPIFVIPIIIVLNKKEILGSKVFMRWKINLLFAITAFIVLTSIYAVIQVILPLGIYMCFFIPVALGYIALIVFLLKHNYTFELRKDIYIDDSELSPTNTSNLSDQSIFN